MLSAAALPIDLHDVRKTFRGKVHALRGVRMQVHAGEIFGLLGPNGAGKSTLVKIMMTVVRPTHAKGTLLGAPIGHKPTLARVGFLPEHHRFPGHLTGRQVIDLFGGLAGVPRVERRRRTGQLLETVRMSEWADKLIGGYSKGMQQRIGLAAALVNDPALILLDEPTDGVDPVGRREFRDAVIALRAAGRTVFINSHLLSELEMVADRLAIMVQGEVVAQGTMDELTAGSRRYEVVVAGPAPAWASGMGVAGRPAVDGRSTLVVDSVDPEAVQPLIDRLRAEGRTIVSVRSARESLEDLFMRAVMDPSTGQARRPGAAPPPPRGVKAPPTVGAGAPA